MAAVCDPGSGKLTAAFAGLAKYYGVAIDICPPRHGNRKGVVEKANHSAAQRWWRTLGDDVTVAAAQAGIDALAAQMDGRQRPRDGQRVSVGELAAGEPLRPVPGVPFPAQITAARIVSPQALVAFRGNSYSVPPGISGTTVTVTHRLGSDHLAIATASGAVIARHRRARDGSGLSVREPGHVTALDKAVLASFTTTAPCKRKERRPPSAAALAGAGQLRGACGPAGRVVTGPVRLRCRSRPAAAPSPHRHQGGISEPARHERGAPLPAAARPPVLPQAQPGRRGPAPHPGRGQSRAAVPDPRPGTAAGNRGHRHRGTPPDLPAAVRLPARTMDPGRLRPSPLSPASTRSSSATWPRSGSWTTPATCCSSARPASARLCSPSPWPAPPSRPATGSTSPPPPTWPPGAAKPPWKAAGTPSCGSSAAPACSSSTSSATSPLPADGASALFQVINQRYLRSSTILPANVGIADWAGAFGDATAAAAMLDRLLHRAAVVGTCGTQSCS